jgi:hypothetical protein
MALFLSTLIYYKFPLFNANFVVNSAYMKYKYKRII